MFCFNKFLTCFAKYNFFGQVLQDGNIIFWGMFVIVHVDRLKKKSVKSLFQMWVDRYGIRCLSNSDGLQRKCCITKQNKKQNKTKHETQNFNSFQETYSRILSKLILSAQQVQLIAIVQ
jgi:hypothetical protein